MNDLINRHVLSVVALGVILAGAVAFQMFKGGKARETQSPTNYEVGRLGSIIPSELAGWISRDEPLGNTELLRGAVARNLNYTDYIYRVYTRGSDTFAVYVAYWEPERMPVSHVGAHTPDRCWPRNGWQCEALKTGVVRTGPLGELLPAEWRIFIPAGDPAAKQHVLYWHLVGGQLNTSFNRFGVNPWSYAYGWWKNSMAHAINGSSEQYFIRLTSNRPFENIWNDPGFEDVLAALARLGLAAKS